MRGRAKTVDPIHSDMARRVWFCQFHCRVAGVQDAIPEPSYCWPQYRHECKLVLVRLVPTFAVFLGVDSTHA